MPKAPRNRRPRGEPVSTELADSVVLLSNMNRSTCGTGFVVGHTGGAAYVYTCDHVVDDLGGPEQVWVANRQAKVAFSGRADGIDLAVLQVVGLPVPQRLPRLANPMPKADARFVLWGYSQLHSNSDKYLRKRVTGTLGASVVMRAQTAECGVAAWELNVDADSPALVPGYSGAPVFVDGGEVVAVTSHKFGDRHGLAISTLALRPHGAAGPLWQLPEAADVAVAPDAEAGAWPEPPEGPHPDDPQKGRWGGAPEAGGLKLTAIVKDVKKGVFYFDLVVNATDGHPVGGPARFHLHPTYPRSIITIRKVRPNNTMLLEQVSAVGVYTVGAQVMRPNAEPVHLELDLNDVREIPDRFR